MMITAEEVAENRRKVLAALRSGIKQCYELYVDGECRCATGVVHESIGNVWHPDEKHQLRGRFSGGCRIQLALQVGTKLVWDMIDLNDVEKRTLPQIADWLEQQFATHPLTPGATYEA